MSYLNKALRYLESQVRLRGGVDVSDLANTARTYTAKDGNVCAWDPGGGSVNVTMPAVTASEGLVVLFINTGDAAENLVIKDAAAATIATIGQGGWAFVSCDGAVWKAANLGNQAALAAANTWALLQTFTTGLLIPDAGVAKFGTAGTDLVLTADGTDVAITGTGGLVRADNVVDYFGTGKDIGITWNATKLVVSQAAPNSAIDLGVDGAGIDLVMYGDTASAAATWDQSADSLVLSGVAKIKLQTIAAATGTAIPVTHSGSFPVTTAGAETNTLAIPTFLGQTLTIFVDTYAVGDRVITSAQRINQAGNTIITLGAVGDFIKLEAISIGGALRWQVIANDGAALS